MQKLGLIKAVSCTMALLAAVALQHAFAQTTVTPAEACTIAKEAYITHVELAIPRSWLRGLPLEKVD